MRKLSHAGPLDITLLVNSPLIDQSIAVDRQYQSTIFWHGKTRLRLIGGEEKPNANGSRKQLWGKMGVLPESHSSWHTNQTFQRQTCTTKQTNNKRHARVRAHTPAHQKKADFCQLIVTWGDLRWRLNRGPTGTFSLSASLLNSFQHIQTSPFTERLF